MKNENVVMKIDLPLLRINKKTKIREMYNTAKFVPYTLFIAHTDRVSVRDKVLLSGIPGKGEVLTKVSAYWFRQTREICPNHFITDDFDQLPMGLQEVLEPYKSVLIGRFMFVR